MTQTYYPFDAGPGGNVTEQGWGKMMRGLMNTGVFRLGRTSIDLNLLEVFGDSTGMQVKVKSGSAWIEGFFFESDAQEIIALNAADGTNPRIDRIVARLDRVQDKISLEKLTGTPAASPASPSLTQDTNTWELPLARISVPAADTSIDAGQVTDERVFVFDDLYKIKARNPTALQQTLTDGATINWNMDLGGAAQVTLAGNRTMAAPTNLRAGATYILIVKQDATGSRTLAWNAVFKWPLGLAPVLSTAANATDLLSFYSPDGALVYGNILKGLA